MLKAVIQFLLSKIFPVRAIYVIGKPAGTLREDYDDRFNG